MLLHELRKNNQVYSLQVAFNFMGSYDLSDKFIKRQPKRLMLFCLSVSGRLTRVSDGTMIEVPNIG